MMSQEHQHVSKYHQRYFFQQLDQASNIGNIKHPYYWHFVRGIRRWSMKYPHKGLVMRKLFNVMSSWPESRRQFALCCILWKLILPISSRDLLCFCSLWLYHQFWHRGIESVNQFHWGGFSGMRDCPGATEATYRGRNLLTLKGF